MHNGLLAPQFGLTKPSLPRQPQPDLHEPEALPETPAAAGAGPLVIVKRRRLLQAAEPTPAVEDVTAAPREARVFRTTEVLPALDAPTPVPPTAAQASSEVAPSPPAPLRRRRRDPLKAPTLLQHVVFESGPAVKPSAELISTDEAAAAAQDLSGFFDPASARQYAEIQASLRALRDTVAWCERACRASEELDLAIRSARRRPRTSR